MPESQIEWVVLAHLLRPQGRKGEILSELYTDVPDRFSPGVEVYLAPQDFAGSPAEARVMVLRSSWLPHGRNEGRIVLAFVGVYRIEEAERLAGMEVIVPGGERAPLPEGNIYVDALVGCTLYDRDARVGTVRDLQFPATPDGKRRLEEAAPLLVVDHPSGELLIPFAKDWLNSIDMEEKVLRMTLPEGLLDLNVPAPAGAQKRSAKPSETIG